MSVFVLYAKVSDSWFIEQYNQSISLLNGQEKKRFDKMKSSLKRQQFLLSRVLLLQAATQLLQQKSLILKAEDEQIENSCLENSQIKTYQIENYTQLLINQKYSFSISITHSGSVAAVCISSQQLKLGIDIEKIKPRNFVELAKEFCVEEELTILNNKQYDAYYFYKLWTAKEALTKATQANLTDLFSFNCSNILIKNIGRFDFNHSIFSYHTSNLSYELDAYIGTVVVQVVNEILSETISFNEMKNISWIYYTK
ncbi:4'-phosphopantetheinyl transferase superfamily protein [Colwellia sp. UCD-KL20]|uniref:4'-phosphopantetheinyl transferase family protein n=1 Tax=Colwellia sp. UCD-KL20 TaxID=1917165 RepID=UPI0009703686|nr:4'-phosphopantetheinyl transferase superfamily protein [Colwellia sp. UCD-KL20]